MQTNFSKKSLLSNQARIQAPWVKVQIGDYSFGVFDRKTRMLQDQQGGFYTKYDVSYPNYIKSLNIIKINGKVNQYTLVLNYPVIPGGDPNFIEKVLSSVSNSRKIVFSYGDASMPAYVYKDEEALITGVSQSFQLESSLITYTIRAVSSAALCKSGSFTFLNSPSIPKKPSDEIKRIFKNNSIYGLQNIFTGMSLENLDKLVIGDDKAVIIDSKTNISPVDYILYLVGCMVPEGSTTANISTDMYIMTIHDETVYDVLYDAGANKRGPYFKVSRTSTATKRADAYEIDVGYNTSTIVQQFSVDNNENYAIFYNYNSELSTEEYARRLNNNGKWEDIYAPMATSGNDRYLTQESDAIWFTKITKYPISATIKITGLLRPATLMQYVRLNVVFPGGGRHISSGLYIVTKQVDDITESGYFTTLSMTRIAD